MKSQSLSRFVIMAAVLGVIALICTAVLVPGSTTANVLSWLFDLLALILAFMTGRAAKKRGGSPVWNGALVGALFGVLHSIGGFFAKISTAQMDQKLAGKGLSQSMINQSVALANSPMAHLVGVIGGLIIFGVLGLILGAIGGATTKRDTQTPAE